MNYADSNPKCVLTLSKPLKLLVTIHAPRSRERERPDAAVSVAVMRVHSDRPLWDETRLPPPVSLRLQHQASDYSMAPMKACHPTKLAVQP